MKHESKMYKWVTFILPDPEKEKGSEYYKSLFFLTNLTHHFARYCYLFACQRSVFFSRRRLRRLRFIPSSCQMSHDLPKRGSY